MGRPRILKDIKCLGCGKLFRPRESRRKFCSMKCCYSKKPHRGKWFICPICKKEFYRVPCQISYRGLKNRYCSKKCSYQAKIRGKNFICKNCGKEHFRSLSRNKVKYHFCSWKCYMGYKKTNYMKRRKGKNGKTLLAKMKRVLWDIFSKYIRQRDKGICISCSRKDDWKKMDAGHYIPKSICGLTLYFDEQNVNCQCTYCNRWMHGNLSKYAIALRKRYGETILEDLDKRRGIRKISIPEYQQMIEIYKNKLKKF